MEIDVKRPRCPFCHEEIAPEERKRGCEACMAWQHSSCWQEHGRCAACHADPEGTAPMAPADVDRGLASPADAAVATPPEASSPPVGQSRLLPAPPDRDFAAWSQIMANRLKLRVSHGRDGLIGTREWTMVRIVPLVQLSKVQMLVERGQTERIMERVGAWRGALLVLIARNVATDAWDRVWSGGSHPDLMGEGAIVVVVVDQSRSAAIVANPQSEEGSRHFDNLLPWALELLER